MIVSVGVTVLVGVIIDVCVASGMCDVDGVGRRVHVELKALARLTLWFTIASVTGLIKSPVP